MINPVLPPIQWDAPLGVYSFLPVPVVRESNSELVWRMWDVAAAELDVSSKPRNLELFGINYD